MTDEHLKNDLELPAPIKVNLNRVVQKKSQPHISHGIVSTKIKSYCYLLCSDNTVTSFCFLTKRFFFE